jgi:hypothetical protein
VVSAKIAGIVDNLLNRAECEVLVAEGCIDLLEWRLEEGPGLRCLPSRTDDPSLGNIEG